MCTYNTFVVSNSLHSTRKRASVPSLTRLGPDSEATSSSSRMSHDQTDPQSSAQPDEDPANRWQRR